MFAGMETLDVLSWQLSSGKNNFSQRLPLPPFSIVLVIVNTLNIDSG
jgi:hypothetical protein